VLSVRGLKRFQEKTGALPTLRGSLLGGHNLSNARTTGGSNIRVVESVPVGNMELSLVEVRGRMLLLSSSGGTVSLLTELKDGEEGESEFQSLLGSFGDDDADELDGTIGATVGSLDDYLRDTREAIVRSAQRTLKNRQGRNGGGEDEWIS
jgi:Flagellar biosynthesis protein, FliO.